jgi:hypothetical protein
LLQERTEVIAAEQSNETPRFVDATQGQGVYDQMAAFPVGAIMVN